MKDIQIVVCRPRAQELKRLGWNLWAGTACCRRCGVSFPLQMAGTREHAERWNPDCPQCFDLQEIEDGIWFSLDDGKRWGCDFLS